MLVFPVPPLLHVNCALIPQSGDGSLKHGWHMGFTP